MEWDHITQITVFPKLGNKKNVLPLAMPPKIRLGRLTKAPFKSTFLLKKKTLKNKNV